MAVVKEFKLGAATILINDECVIKDPKELEATNKRISEIIYNALKTQHEREIAKNETA